MRPPHRPPLSRRRFLRVAAAGVAMTIGLSACNLPSGIKSEEQSQEILFPDRPDRQDDDYDRRLGEMVRVDPFEASVASAEFRPELGPNEAAGYIVVEVSVTNVGVGKRDANPFHWQLMTPSGELRNHALVDGVDNQLRETELQRNDEVTGNLVYQIGAERGTFYLVFAPSKDAGQRRGVWGPIEVQ